MRRMRRTFRLLAGVAAGFGLSGTAPADPGLDAALDAIAPGVKKWATVCVVESAPGQPPAFSWHDYRETGKATDFWPASTIKLYAAVATLELLTDRGYPLDTTVTFSHRDSAGLWTVDCARTVREMLSEVFRRSSNEDYTLLLRVVGIDRINTRFLIPEKGFSTSALMRGYVTGRPWAYIREEPQRIRLQSPDGLRSETHEHAWSGKSYAEERGATIIDRRTGNVTSPRELAECLRRVLFHEHLPPAERYALTAEQLRFLRHGGSGLFGLENKGAESSPSAWKGGAATVFPEARFFHKCGAINDYALEVACVDDTAHSGRHFLLVPAVNAGLATKPTGGEAIVGEMSRAIATWVSHLPAPASTDGKQAPQ